MKTLFLVTSILLLQIACLAQDKIYILFEDKVDGMHKPSDDSLSFYYTIELGKHYWIGFRPKAEKDTIVSEVLFNKQIKPVLKDINWLRYLDNHYPDSLKNKNNLYIVEKVRNYSYRITHVSNFEAME